VLFEKAYHDLIWKVARDNIDKLPPRPEGAASSEEQDGDMRAAIAASMSSSASSKHPGQRYLDDVAKLDTSDLGVQFLQNLTLFVLETYARAHDTSRIDQWCILLQHGYNAHVGCCEWLLERFVLDPPLLDEIMLHCPLPVTRKSVAGLLELAVKKLIRFEVDDEFVDAEGITLPPLKSIQKRRGAGRTRCRAGRRCICFHCCSRCGTDESF